MFIEAGDKKIGADGGHFSEMDIDNLTSYPVPMQFMSLHDFSNLGMQPNTTHSF